MNSFLSATDERDFGGCFMPESLIAPLTALHTAFMHCKQERVFLRDYHHLLTRYAGRPTALTEVPRFRTHCQGPRVVLKREDLLHTGAHKINNALGQCLLARYMGKTQVIAETGAGQHGVATATACAHLGLSCLIFMGAHDAARQQPNVAKIKLLGADLQVVETGTGTLKEAVNAALRAYATDFETTHYCLGSALGPAPYPEMVAYFQSIIGDEAQTECMQRYGQHPDTVIACVGGGSNAIGVFAPFISDPAITLIGVEAGGTGPALGEHAARFVGGKPGVLHGCYSYVLQDKQGQIAQTHSISAGLDYPMIGPQHAALYQTGRVHYRTASDTEAREALQALSTTEGIIPALESSHALAYYQQHAQALDPESLVLINLSGRGDKDLPYLQSRGLL